MSEDTMLRYLQKAVIDIVLLVAQTDMMNEAAKMKALRQIDNILSQYGRTVEEVFPEDLIMTYFKGVERANALLIAEGLALRHIQVLTAEGKIARPFQKVIHLQAVERLVQSSMGDMGAAIRTARLSSGLAVEKALLGVREELVSGLLQGSNRKYITKRVMDTFLKEGLTSFTTVDGKQLPLDFYASTVVRTKLREAAVMGARNRYMDTGQDLVQIVGNGDSCAMCSTYIGMVLSLEGKTPGFPLASGYNQPPFHPNCNCGERPFVIEYKSESEIQAAMNRNSEYAPGVDRRTPEQKAMYENQQRLRRLANAEKKQFMRWQGGMGADAPKTLGAFRRMKRGNTLKFQELQSNYRSLAMSKGK